jgi:hypothetical protein
VGWSLFPLSQFYWTQGIPEGPNDQTWFKRLAFGFISILAWRIPETEEPNGLLSMGSHRVGHD